MKILAYVPHYVGYNHNAGAELTLHEMLVALRNRGHDVTVLLSAPIEGVTPFVIDRIKVQPYSSRKDLLLYSFDTEVIITQLGPAEQAAIVGSIKQKPVIQLVHNDHPITQDAIAAGADLIVWNTNWIKNKLSHRFGNYESVVLRPAVRPDNYRTTRGDSVLLVNLWRNKGGELFWELAKRNPRVNFIGVLGGYGEQIVPSEIPDNVTIYDNTPDIREIFEQTKLVLMPSAYESYGRVAIEAAASGIPSIVSNTPGLHEALGDSASYCPSPLTEIPGENAGNWTEDQVDAWDKELKKALTPASYGKRSKAASRRSEEVWETTGQELIRFTERVERLVGYGPNYSR